MRDLILYLGVGLGTIGAIAFGFSMPALTADATRVSSDGKFISIQERETLYCQASVLRADCQCFAHVSGYVLEQDAPRIRGAIYADRLDLARGQAAGSC
jgi:hypothetical protein